jgi:hypothetical protein
VDTRFPCNRGEFAGPAVIDWLLVEHTSRVVGFDHLRDVLFCLRSRTARAGLQQEVEGWVYLV